MVIHRSANKIIVSEPRQPRRDARSSFEAQEDKFCGWNTPAHKYYKPMGTFHKVVPVIEELKLQLDNALDVSPDTQKLINSVKRNPDSIYVGGEEPKRTWKSLRRGVVSLRSQEE